VRSSHHGSVLLFVNKFVGVTRQKVGGVRGSVCRAGHGNSDLRDLEGDIEFEKFPEIVLIGCSAKGAAKCLMEEQHLLL
jgi:hypothetical protein